MTSRMDVKSWFECLGHFRTVYDICESTCVDGQAILNIQLHDWSQVLEARHLAVLVLLQDELDMVVLVQACLLGWRHGFSILRVLAILSGDGRLEVQQALLEAIRATGANARDFDEHTWATILASVSAVV